MAWKDRSIMSLREEFVRLASVPDANVSLLCRRFGISRKSGYKWLARYRAGGTPALADGSRRPRHSPRQSDAATERAVVQVRAAHPAWGPRKIRRWLLDRQGAAAAAAGWAWT